MPLAGLRLLPREIAQVGRAHWKNLELVKMVATTLGESGGYVGAWHDNLDDSGQATSRDCGLMQINVHQRDIGTQIEDGLRTETHMKGKALDVARDNVQAGYLLYEQPWVRSDGGHGERLRRWEPWVAYTTGWATFPAWYVWHQIAGKSVGPWLPTGRYLHQAIAGVANYHHLIAHDMTLAEAKAMATALATHFGVKGSIREARDYVAWDVPMKPLAPPDDGIGLRPVPNDGT